MEFLLAIGKLMLGVTLVYVGLTNRIAETRAWLLKRNSSAAGSLRTAPVWKVSAHWAGMAYASDEPILRPAPGREGGCP